MDSSMNQGIMIYPIYMFSNIDKLPDKTIVWYAQPGVQRGSTVQLTADGQLVLSNQTGQEIWNAATTGISYAAMLDTGNFVLASNNSVSLWQSFNEPSDTMLPTQALGPSNELSSHQSDSDYSVGRFQLQLINGDLALNSIALPTGNSYGAYWTTSANTLGSGSQVVFNQSGYIYIEMSNGSSVNLTSGEAISTTGFYQRATLDPDGVFRKYVYPKNSSTNSSWQAAWSAVWSVPEDICSATVDIGTVACGYNSYCTLNGDQPICNCLPGYSYIDPNNARNGCKSDFVQQNCDTDGSEAESMYVMSDLTNTNWPTSDYNRLTPMNEDDCRKSCLRDCLCAVAIFGSSGCWKKKLPLSNGIRGVTDSKALIKVPKNNSSSQYPLAPVSDGRKKDRTTLILVGTVLLGVSVFINLLLLSGISIFSFSHHKQVPRNHQDSVMVGINLRSFTYKELKEATDMFKEEVGKGSFGTVYKGVLGNEMRTFIAVKRLDKVVQEGEKEFRAEVNAIGQTHHKNLVQLLGYCNEGPHRLLVYEFMGNGSLASYLFGSTKPSWHRRMDIALGIARGLMYLHEECSSQIIHCDIKPQNILLDDQLRARISDFGLAKLLKADQTRTNTGIRGTKGYVAPEWFRSMPITAKVDVYSFGVLLLEIICCRKNFEQGLEISEKTVLADWAYDCYMKGRMDILLEDEAEVMNDAVQLERSVAIVFWCIQEDPSLRPSMKRVMQMLEGAADVPVPPDPSSFFSSLN